MESIARLLIGGAVLVMAAAAGATIWRLVTGLPAGRMRNDWYVLLAFIACFIFGYLYFLFVSHQSYRDASDLIAPGMFFAGAAFVALVSRIMLRTAQDLIRVSVLEAENVTDALTGLYNRREFDRRWAAELARAERFGVPLSLLMVDIDHFKNINDGYGHTVGDKVLMTVSRLVRDCLRKSDTAARYGGEELAVIVPHTRPDTAVSLAERIRITIEREARQALGARSAETGVTVSIGVAGLDNVARDGARIFERADEALYAAKRRGRNCVVVASPPK